MSEMKEIIMGDKHVHQAGSVMFKFVQYATAEQQRQPKAEKGFEEPKAMKAKGRPRAPELAACFHEGVDAKVCIERMRPLIEGRKGREVVLVLKAAMRLKWLATMPKFSQLEGEYGALGNARGFREQMNHGYFDDDEIEMVMAKLRG